ncbi:MAG: hypothetical protein ACUZ8H_03330 [Candidatus Anammoxibacter sp.]
MEKTHLLNEIKFLELKLGFLKAQVEFDKSEISILYSSNLYGVLKNSDDITLQDIDHVKIKLKEPH